MQDMVVDIETVLEKWREALQEYKKIMKVKCVLNVFDYMI